MNFSDLENIAKIYDIKLIEMQDGQIEGLCNVDKKEIYIKINKNNELYIATFFHELGHILSGLEYRTDYEKNKFKYEAIAWRIGFGIAKLYNLEFSAQTIEQCFLYLLSYEKLFIDDTDFL